MSIAADLTRHASESHISFNRHVPGRQKTQRTATTCVDAHPGIQSYCCEIEDHDGLVNIRARYAAAHPRAIIDFPVARRRVEEDLLLREKFSQQTGRCQRNT
jgi:hypothetical protein